MDKYELGGLESPVKDIEEEPKKSFCQALANPIPSGSKISAVFSVMKATLGAGALSLPYTMLSAGVVLGVILLTMMAVFSMLSLELIVRAVHKSGKETYEDLVDALFGHRWGYLYQLAMFIFCFGTAAVYIVVIYDVVSPVTVHAFGESPDSWYGYLLVNRFWFSTLVTLVVLLPLSLMKTIDSIRYLTCAGSICACFLVITSVYVLGRYGVSPTFTSTMLWKPVDLGSLVSAFNTYIFAFANQPNIPEIFTELSVATPRNMRKVTLFSTITALGVYALEGIVFLVAYGALTQSNILTSLGPRLNRGDPVIAATFLTVAVSIIGTFPLNIYPVRITILHSLKPKKYKTIIGMIIVILTVGLAFAVALAMPDVNVILGMVGALAGSVICFLGPAAFNITLDGGEMFTRKKAHYWAIIVIGIVAFVLGTYIAILDAIEFYHDRSNK